MKKPSRRTRKAREKRAERRIEKAVKKHQARSAMKEREQRMLPSSILRALPKERDKRYLYHLYRSWKKSELTSREAFRVAKLQRDAERIHYQFKEKGLEWGDACLLADIYAVLPKEVLRKHGLPSIEAFTQEYLRWRNRQPRDELAEMDYMDKESEFMDHLEVKITGEPDFLKRLAVESELPAELSTFRLQESGISGEAMLDARVHLRQFRRLFLEKKLWRGEAVNYFVDRLRVWKQRNYARVNTVKGFQEKVASELGADIDSFKDVMKKVEEMGDAWRPEYHEMKDQVLVKEAFRSYLLALIAKQAHALGLKVGK